MPKAITRNNFDKLITVFCSSVTVVAQESMFDSAQELIFGETEVLGIGGAVDGSWHCRVSFRNFNGYWDDIRL